MAVCRSLTPQLSRERVTHLRSNSWPPQYLTPRAHQAAPKALVGCSVTLDRWREVGGEQMRPICSVRSAVAASGVVDTPQVPR